MRRDHWSWGGVSDLRIRTEAARAAGGRGRGPATAPPGAARATSAFLAVGVTSAAAACAHVALPPQTPNTHVTASFGDSPPPPTTPAALSETVIRLAPGGAPAASPVILRPARILPAPPTPSGHLGRPQATRERLPLPPPTRASRSPATWLQTVPPRGHPAGTQRPSLSTPIPPYPSSSPTPPRRDRGNPSEEAELTQGRRVRGWAPGSVPRGVPRPATHPVPRETRPKRHAVRGLSYPKCPTGSTLFFVCRFQNWPCNSQTL